MFRIHMLPAEDGDCFLIETGSADAPHRILVDGGRKDTAERLLALLDGLPRRGGPAIDLMVLTHIDADHIEGLLDLVADERAPEVGEIWFNGLDHLKIAAGRKQAPPWPPPPPPVSARREPPQPVLGIKQAADFSRAVSRRGWRWNAAFRGGPAMAARTGDLPAVPLPGGGRIVLLGPPQNKLVAFVDEWEAEFRRLCAPSEPTLAARARPVVRLDTVEQIARTPDTPDRTRPNGTSITFAVEYDGRRALFGADAHPGDLADVLDRYDPGAARVVFDAVKAPHHGSARNNTSALIDRIESPLWLVSSNGSRRPHPDPETIARIVLAPNRNKEIVFNYRTEFNEVWADPRLVRHYGYTVRFPAGQDQTRPGVTMVDLA